MPTCRALRRSLIAIGAGMLALGAGMLALGACGPGSTSPPTTSPPTIDEAVTIHVVVEGSGHIIWDSLTLDCRGDCSWQLPGDRSIDVQAIPSTGNVFAGWDGACDVLPNPCHHTFEDGDSLTATFAPHALRLALTGDGEGAFEISGGGVAAVCDRDCAVPLTQPLQLAITYAARGTTGTVLGAWTGPCDPDHRHPDYCLVQVSGATEVGKTFTHPPRAFADAYETTWETTLTIAAPGVLANDVDTPGDVLTAELVTGVANGTLALAANGGFSYTPASGFYGTDGFSYRARDAFGNLSNTADVTITVDRVDRVNRPPVANGVAYETDRDETLTIAAPGVLANDTDPDGDPLTASLEADATRGILALSPDGSFTYTPELGYVGLDSFAYSASDGELTSAPATVTITIRESPVARAPSAVDDTYRTTRNASLRVPAPGVLANDVGAEGAVLTAVLDAGVRYGTLTLYADGSFHYAPRRGFVGVDHFTYSAADGVQRSDPATVTITVAPK